jgi:hypothetical protein
MTLNTEEHQAKWIELGDKLLQLAGAIYSEADLLESEMGATDPKVVALALLCRTVGNFRGALSIVEQGLIVEAQYVWSRPSTHHRPEAIQLPAYPTRAFFRIVILRSQQHRAPSRAKRTSQTASEMTIQ